MQCEWLPVGWNVDRRISATGSFGDVLAARDESRPECGVVHLRVRITPSAEGTRWAKPFQERVRKCYGRHWPHVSPLSDVRRLDDGSWVLSHPAPMSTLADKLQVEQGLGIEFAHRCAKQVLAGLAELHLRGLHHGGLRPENIWIESLENEPASFAFTLGEVEIGDLADWSKNEFLENHEVRYHPHGRAGIDRDLYAVGVMLVEILHGRQAVQNAINKRQENGDGGDGLASLLTRAPISSEQTARLYDLARHLLSTNANKPGNPQKALALLSRPSRRLFVATAATATVCVAIFSLLVGRCLAARAAADGSAEQVSSLTQQLNDVRYERDRWERKAKDPPVPPPPLRQALAQRQWSEMLATDKRSETDAYLAEILNRVEKLQTDGQAPEEFKTWYRIVVDRRTKFSGWERSDPQRRLPELLRSVASSPWDAAIIASFDARKEALEAATAKWREWVAEDRTSQSVGDAAKALSPDERAIVEGWIGQFNDRTNWKIRLNYLRGEPNKVSISAQGLVTIEVDKRMYRKLNLSSPYDQSFTALNERDLDFVWRPDKPITVWLENYKWPVNTDLAHGEFKGPFALQRLHWAGVIGVTDTVTLTFEIPDCPGPPSPQTLAQIAGSGS